MLAYMQLTVKQQKGTIKRKLHKLNTLRICFHISHLHGSRSSFLFDSNVNYLCLNTLQAVLKTDFEKYKLL